MSEQTGAVEEIGNVESMDDVGVPEKSYWDYVVEIKGKPYMRVDGRVRMAQDEHAEKGEKLTMQTEYVEIAGKPHFRAVVHSTLHGTVSAHSIINIGGKGVDATNPIENAETSAIGRALGFMGYGLTGSGIASAEEVLRATSQRESGSRKFAEVTDESMMTHRPVVPVEEGDWNTPGNFADQTRERAARGGRQMSEKQESFLLGLLSNHGVQESDKRALIAALFPEGLTSGMASSEIDELKEAPALPRHWINAYTKMLRTRAGIEGSDVQMYIREKFGEDLASSLAKEEQAELFNWLRSAAVEEDIAF